MATAGVPGAAKVALCRGHSEPLASLAPQTLGRLLGRRVTQGSVFDLCDMPGSGGDSCYVGPRWKAVNRVTAREGGAAGHFKFKG